MPEKKPKEPLSLAAALDALEAGEPQLAVQAALLSATLTHHLSEAQQGRVPAGKTLLATAALKEVLITRAALPPAPPGSTAPGAFEFDVDAMGAGFAVERGVLRLDLSAWMAEPGIQADAGQLRRILEAIAGAGAVLPPLEEELVQWLQPALRPVRAPRRRAAALEPFPSLMKFPADRIHKGAVEAFSTVDQWRRRDRFFRAHEVSGSQKDFAMICGFPNDPGEEIWNLLLARGEAVIKAHYALWARLYEQTGGQPGQYAVININQFCADLGYRPHHKGGFKRERKQEAMRLLEALTTVEVAIRFRVQGRADRIRELSGRLWERGYAARERDQYGDLLGQARVGEPDLWDPVGFSFGPGPWFADAAWRKQNRYLGLIGSGLMKLQPDNDQAAIRIGGYLGTLARFDQYRARRLRIATLLERIGIAQRYPNNPQRLQEKVEEALRKLVEVGILARWGYTDADPSEPDMDDLDTLAGLADTTLIPWRRLTIEIEWPEILATETVRLENAEQRAATPRPARRKPRDSSETR